MPAPDAVIQLVHKFKNNIDAYRAGTYNEAQLRQEFVNPLFAALGWDMDNTQGYAEAYKEVIHEDSIAVGSATKAPDYCFRLGGTRKFFVETKKPSINIKDDLAPAFQLRRYAWSAKLPLSVLTDFEEFAVYDCRIKPTKTDKSSVGRVLFMTFEEYVDRWDEISGVFSKDAILKGAFDKYAETGRAKKGTTAVDDAFLSEIENWRELLARSIALRNEELTQHELNFSVQRTIDRLIFLRICEDRGIEHYGTLMALLNGENIYKRLVQIFHHADEKYNSGLFHFQPEKSRPETPDEVTLTLLIDDKPLKEIVRNLYYPDCPYEFSVFSSDILGQVYEQFLGKVIRLTAGHRAVVEEKPEVKKAGGVYYTPTYIVDYIIKNTVGKLVEDKTPKQVSLLRILDPACGSGSFLIGAYQFLLNWHVEWYAKDGAEKYVAGKTPALYKSQSGDWKLTTAERKRILLNNIYGVDIDSQAVEVTKLSLLLKVLEGENEQTISSQMKLFHERALPDLGNNIKCGNSLIGSDFYQNKQMGMFQDEEKYRINVFDWDGKHGFEEIMKSGGFDAVVGNPPYVFGRDWKALNISDDVKNYLGNKYKSSSYQLDMFSIFIEKAHVLCRFSGKIGQIVPNVWLNNIYSASTRAFLLSNSRDFIIAIPPLNVFYGLTVDTIVYSLTKSEKPGDVFNIFEISSKEAVKTDCRNVVEYKDGKSPISTTISSKTEFILRFKKSCIELKALSKITRGVHPYRVGGYGQTAFGSGVQTARDVEERPYNSSKLKSGYRPFIYGRDLKRFCSLSPSDYIKYGQWLAEPRQAEFFEGDRIYSRKILGERLVVTIEKGDSVTDQQVYITKPTHKDVSVSYLAGVIGSKLLAFFIKTYYNEANDAFPQIKVSQLQALPIIMPDKSRHDRMVSLVEQMLELNKQLPKAKTEQDKVVIQRQIEGTDSEIDKLVYTLYGLTEEEIMVVEGQNE